MNTVVLSYKLKLFPTRNKADTLANLSALFVRLHTVFTAKIADGQGRYPSTKGCGGFAGRVARRAFIDYRRGAKAARALNQPYIPGVLTAELIDSAEIQQPRQAHGFDLWCMIRGTKERGGFHIPARRHKAFNRAMALPGAVLNTSAEVFRKNGKWYVRVSVTVPVPDGQSAKGWLGCDVGVRRSVVRSDGYKGPDLRPVLRKMRDRRAEQQRQGVQRQSFGTFQKQVLAREARRIVSVARKTGQGIALEDPKRLPRWKQWAARHLAERVHLLSVLEGIPVALIAPPYTSVTCSRCGSVEKGQRHKEIFRCWRCGFTHNADYNAARNIACRAVGLTVPAVSHGCSTSSSRR